MLILFPFMAQQPLLGQDLPTIQAPRSHPIRHTTISTTPLDESSDQLDVGISDNTQHSQETDIHASGGIRTHNSNTREAPDPRLRPRGRRDRQRLLTEYKKSGKRLGLFTCSGLGTLQREQRHDTKYNLLRKELYIPCSQENGLI